MTAIHTHYDNLKVARDAPEEVIRAAYKTLSQKYHPDRNLGNPNAARVMTLLNTSYDVLSDPSKRRAHDLWIAQQERASEERKREASSPPPPPKYPPPPIRPRRGRIAFLHVARYWVYYGLACLFLWAIFFKPPVAPPPGPKPYQAAAPVTVAVPTPLPSHTTCKTLGSTPTVYVCTYPDGTRTFSRKPPSDAIINSEADQDAIASSSPARNEQPAYVRSPNAPNGYPWPSSANYVDGYPKINTQGLSMVTVDNSQDSSDVFVKLVSLDGDKAFPVRQFYIPAFSQFTVKKVRTGTYDIRYRDLESGGLSRTPSFTLEEVPVENGMQYSEIRMTLYKVQHGNMETYPLAESEF